MPTGIKPLSFTRAFKSLPWASAMVFSLNLPTRRSLLTTIPRSYQVPTESKCYFLKSHKKPCLPPSPPPPRILHNHSLQFLLGNEDILREIENNDCAKFWRGGGGKGETRCGFEKVENRETSTGCG